MKFITRIISLTSIAFIYEVCLPEQVIAQEPAVLNTESVKIECIQKINHETKTYQSLHLQRKANVYLFDMQFIMNNEPFTLQRVYEKDDENIRSCVFESSSALWTIHYCGEMEENLETPWYLRLAGSFSIKDTDIHLEYYLERESHIYRNIEYGSLAFTRNLSLMKMNVIDGSACVDAGWSQNRLLFLQILARTQEQYIEQSLTAEPKLGGKTKPDN